MNLRNLFIVNTIIALIFAVALLLAPKTMHRSFWTERRRQCNQ